MIFKLKDIAEFNPRESIECGTIAKKVAMEHLTPFQRFISDYSVEPFQGGTKFRNGDTIMARITPCLENGKIAKVTILDPNEIGFGSTEYIVFRAKQDLVDEDYLYYMLCSNTVREVAIKSMVGSSGRQRVQTNVLKELEIDLPSKAAQVKIGSILSSLDIKIELNNKISENLQQQAKAIFSVYLVNIDSIPDSWQTTNLLSIADYQNGLAMQKFRPIEGDVGLPVLKIRELRMGACDDNSELCSSTVKPEFKIKDGDVIFSWSGSLLVDIWCGGECGLNQHLFKVTSAKYDKWFYYLWTLHHLESFISIAADKATTMGHIKREDLAKAKVTIPDKETYQKLSAILTPMLDLMITTRVESKRLAAIRDSLLPKLMSGEIKVD